MLSQLSMVAAQSNNDAKRLKELGLAEQQLMVTGSIKFDIEVPKKLVTDGRALRASWDLDRKVWIAASTHHDEEETLLKVFAEIREKITDALLILVPRHPERFDKIASLCQQQGFTVVRRSEGQPCTAKTNIFMGDSMGEMFMYYAMADCAFVGGSFVPVGGHNLLEPAAIGIPVISGPHVFNFSEIANLLVDAGAATLINNREALTHTLFQLLQNANLRAQQGANGQKVIAENRGALKKHLTWIAEQLQ